MTNIRDPEFNPNVAQVYTEEPGYTGYKGLDFTKIDNIEDILKSGINVNITGASTNFTINSAEVSVSNEVEIKNQIGNPVPISNESIDNLKNNFNNLIFSDSSAPSGLVVYQTNLNKDLDSATVVISGNLPEVSGTVTANAGNFASVPGDGLPSKLAVVGAYLEDDHEVFPIPLVVNGLESSRQGVGVHVGTLPPISGTVTANLDQANFRDALANYAGDGPGFPVRPDGDFAISDTFTNLDWIYVAGSFTKTIGGNTTPTLYLNTYFKRDSKTSWSSWAYPAAEDKCTATIYNVIIDDRAYWKLDVNHQGLNGPVNVAIGTLATFTLIPPSIYSEIPPKTGWSINTDDGFAGDISVSYDQPSVQPISGTVTANVFGHSNQNNNTLYQIPVCEDGNADYLLRHIPIGFVNSNNESAIVSNTTPLPVTAIQERSSNISNFNSSETNGTVLSANSNRKELYIQNLATGNLYVKYGESASASSFNFVLAPNTSENAGDGGSLSDQGYAGIVSVFGSVGPRYISWERS